jgi:hypothetical protein
MASIPPLQNLVVVRGDTFSRVLDLSFATGDLTGVTKMWMTAKVSASDLDSAAVFQITTGAGITVLSTTSARFDVSAATMKLLTQPTYVYDVQCLLASGEIRTAARGNLTVADEITQAIG